jgi:glycosyltransferase involved in cell wall biosynthesis
MSTTFIILPPSSKVGGVEKRLAGLFLHLAARSEPVRLVSSTQLLRELRATPDCAELPGEEDPLVEAFEVGRDPFADLRGRVRELLRSAPDGVFHYVLVSPLRIHDARSKRTLFTIPNASLAQYNARGKLEVYGGIVRATRVDVLDPQVFRELAGRFPWRRGSFSLTPGSYVDLDVFRPLPAAQKKDRIAFVGLLSEEKQAPRLARCLSELLHRLREAGFPEAEVVLLGRDSGPSVSEMVNGLGDERARAYYTTDPSEVLRASKVFLSLQRSTNHPSKALLEAMASGCAPVVTDTRDSRRSAPDSLALYVPREFSAADLAAACITLLRRSNDQADEHTAAMRAFLGANFSVEAMASYYRMLYDQLRALG